MADCPTKDLGWPANPDKPIGEYDTQKIEKMYNCTVDRTAYDRWYEQLAKKCAVDSCITTEDSTKKCTECVFPFTLEGITHTACTNHGGYSKPWCGTKTDENGVYQNGNWGYCNMDKCPDELTQACAVDSCITTKDSKQKCSKCTFPFTYDGITHTACTTQGGTSKPWCATSTDENGNYQSGNWGYCDMDKNCPEELTQACASYSCTTDKCTECVFPFTVWGKTYYVCTDRGEPAPWCSTKTDENGEHVTGNWGFCNMDKCEDELYLACKEDSCITTRESTKKCTKCVFPFTYEGETFHTCTSVGEPAPWCSTKTDENGNHVPGIWGFCDESKCPT